MLEACIARPTVHDDHDGFQLGEIDTRLDRRVLVEAEGPPFHRDDRAHSQTLGKYPANTAGNQDIARADVGRTSEVLDMDPHGVVSSCAANPRPCSRALNNDVRGAIGVYQQHDISPKRTRRRHAPDGTLMSHHR